MAAASSGFGLNVCFRQQRRTALDPEDKLAANCVPEAIMGMDVEQFDEFLKRRRELMAAKVRIYYEYP